MSDPAKNATQYFIGTSGWTYDDWKGRFYPESLPKKRWFEYYASQFNTVEVNATFYRTFKDETYEKWRQNAPQGFGYVLKVPRLITHRKYLLDVDEDIKSFFASCTILQEKFEMVLLQVAPNMPYEPLRLLKALRAFPQPEKVAVEFRRPAWLNPDIMSLLASVGATICNVDSPQHKITEYISSKRAYLRLHGRKAWYAYNYTREELAEIDEIATALASKGAEKMYIFFNNDYNANAITNARALRELLGDKSDIPAADGA